MLHDGQFFHGAVAIQAHIEMGAIILDQGLGQRQIATVPAVDQRGPAAAGQFVVHQAKRVFTIDGAEHRLQQLLVTDRADLFDLRVAQVR